MAGAHTRRGKNKGFLHPPKKICSVNKNSYDNNRNNKQPRTMTTRQQQQQQQLLTQHRRRNAAVCHRDWGTKGLRGAEWDAGATVTKTMLTKMTKKKRIQFYGMAARKNISRKHENEQKNTKNDWNTLEIVSIVFGVRGGGSETLDECKWKKNLQYQRMAQNMHLKNKSLRWGSRI